MTPLVADRPPADDLDAILPVIADGTAARIIGGARLIAVPAFVPAARHLLRARDLADARYFEPLDVDDMARAAGLSRAHFSREFRRAFGETPHAYLLTRRLERAAALLRMTDRSVAEICFYGRPAEPGLVHHQLHATYGMSPTAYRAAYPPAAQPRPGPDLRSARLRPPATQHVWRRQGRRAGLASLAGHSTTDQQEEPDDQDRQRAALGPRPGGGARVLHRRRSGWRSRRT